MKTSHVCSATLGARITGRAARRGASPRVRPYRSVEALESSPRHVTAPALHGPARNERQLMPLSATDGAVPVTAACVASTLCLHCEAAQREMPGLLRHALRLHVGLLRGQSSPDGARLLGAQVQRLVLLRNSMRTGNTRQAQTLRHYAFRGAAPCWRKRRAAPSSVAPG